MRRSKPPRLRPTARRFTRRARTRVAPPASGFGAGTRTTDADQRKGKFAGGRDNGGRDKGGRDKAGRDKGGRDSGPSHRQYATSASPRERDRPIDPNSPFAKLAALKDQLTANRKDR